MVCDSVIAQQFSSYKQLKQLPPTCEKGGVILVQYDENFNHACRPLEEQYSGCLGTVFAATCSSDVVQQCFGVLRKPDQTIKATLNVKHPMDLQIPLPDLLLQAVATVLKLGPGVVAERRAVHCNRILKRIRELETEERVLHESLHPQVRSVLQGKRLLIWRELMVEAGYPDLEIFDEVTEGIKLVGPAHEPQAFLAGMTPAQPSVSQLRSQAIWRRKTSIGKCRTSGNTSADVELWEQSLNEVNDGWLDGPFYDETEVSERAHTTDWICTRICTSRFPLQQPTKIRLLDDGLESGLNSAYSCYNKLTLTDMDAVVALANMVLQAVASKGVFRVSLSTGELLTGKVHAGWNSDSTLLGRTLDLSAAYKQLAASPSQGLSGLWWLTIRSNQGRRFSSSMLCDLGLLVQFIASTGLQKVCGTSWYLWEACGQHNTTMTFLT